MPTYEASDLKVNVDFTGHVDGDKDKDLVKYQATVVFSSLEELLKAGGESVTRKLQTQARGGSFPVGRRVTVDEKGKYSQTKEEKVQAALQTLAETEDEEYLEKMFQFYQEKKAAKLAAEKEAANVKKVKK